MPFTKRSVRSGNTHREAERDQREVEALHAQGREPDERAHDEAQRHRDRDRRHDVPAVIGDEDRRRVRAEPEERAVPDRHLAVVTGEDVEPGRRDPDVDRLGVEPHVGRRVLLRDPVAEARTTAATAATIDTKKRPRGVTRAPRGPCRTGRRAGTAARRRISPNGTRSSMPSSASMYCVVSAFATPTIRPPTTAPTGLSKPPRAAAANAIHEDRLHRRGRERRRRRDHQRAGHRTERRREPPPEHQHRPDRHTDEPARLGVRRDRTEREPDLRLLEQQPEQEALEREHTDEHERVRLDDDAAEIPVVVRVGARHLQGLDAEDDLRERVQREEHPDRDDHDHQRRRTLDRSHHDAFDERTTTERQHDRQEDRQPHRQPLVGEPPRDVRRDECHLALREVEDARRLVDEHERQRERRVDRRPGRCRS